MFRPGRFAVLLFTILLFAVIAAANPPDDPDSRFNKALCVQTALARARVLLSEKSTQKAVDVLEDNLPKVNGNGEYLLLLRDAYRVLIRDLLLAGDAEHARRYLNRLCILDPSAADDPALRPAVDTPPRDFKPEPAANNKKFPTFSGLFVNPFAKKEEPKAAPMPDVYRGLPASAAVEDPFEGKNRRDNPLEGAKADVARELLERGAAEFKAEHYAEARQCFERAYQTQTSSVDVCREQWAYCILKGVEEALAQPGALPDRLADLQNQVDGAIKMAPTKMMAVGQQLHTQLEQRAKQAPVGVTKVSHRGANADGWHVSETSHFRIFHKQDNETAERAAKIAETTRLSMYRKWFGHDGGAWEPICELILHPTAESYTRLTDVSSNVHGHALINADPSGRVYLRRLDMRMDTADVLDTVLPHETTHVVLAGMFGVAHLPRWCDEGIAVLSEPNEKIERHRQNLLRQHAEGQLFGLKELMELDKYPHPRRIGAFYAQSVVLTEFLTKQKGPRVLVEFIKDGLRSGYDQALQKHYDMTFAQLEQLWQRQVLTEPGRFTAQK